MKNNIFPFWMIAAAVFIAINFLVLGISLYVSPSVLFNEIIIENDNVLILSHHIAASFIGIGIAVIVALFMQSVSMLKLSMTVCCIITLQETILGFAHDDTSLMVRSFVFCVLAAFILFISNGLKRKRKRLRFLKTNDSTSNKSSVDTDDDD